MIGLQDGYGSEPSEAALPDPPPAGAVFGESGWLARALRLEHRPQQAAMADAVQAAFAQNTPLFFEAGTGVGKSLAYLIPGIFEAVARERPFLVSTHTIALQEQILKKDLEICRHLFLTIPELAPFRDFRTALMVGRGNYLCGTRLALAMESRRDLFSETAERELQRIVDWSMETETGLVQELPHLPDLEIWDAVNADGPACNPRNCKPDTCFYRRARLQMERAHVVVVNHSLLFSLLAAGLQPRGKTPGILRPNDFAVLDEAHTVPAVATDHFGERLSSFGLRRALQRLYHNDARRKKPSGLIVRNGWNRDGILVQRTQAAADQFFDHIRETLLHTKTVVRLHEPKWAPPLLDEPLAELISRLGSRIEQMEEGAACDEVTGARNLLNTYLQSIRNCVELADPDEVYWLEQTGRQKNIITLRSAPINVAPHLHDALFARQTGIVLTSATLAAGRSLDSFMASVGASGAPGKIVTSPFDFARNMRVYVAEDAPLPTRDTARLDSAYLADMITFCAQACPGGSLVLFTSYAEMNRVAALVEEDFARAGRPFLMQGRDGSRTDLVERMRRQGNTILFGTDSFWTGIDVSGPALSQVIITRLPFENPSEPVAQAKAERCEAEGGSPFTELMLPAALMKFRQGIGRLIRTRNDCGTIVILDARVLRKAYGRAFLDVLPVDNWIRLSRANRASRFEPF